MPGGHYDVIIFDDLVSERKERGMKAVMEWNCDLSDPSVERWWGVVKNKESELLGGVKDAASERDCVIQLCDVAMSIRDAVRDHESPVEGDPDPEPFDEDLGAASTLNLVEDDQGQDSDLEDVGHVEPG